MNSIPRASSPDHLQPVARLPRASRGLGFRVLAWPAWGRALAVTPVLMLLWRAVAWALTDVAPL